MGKRGGGPGFLEEALPGFFIMGPFRRQELEGHGPLKLDVLGPIDDCPCRQWPISSWIWYFPASRLPWQSPASASFIVFGE